MEPMALGSPTNPSSSYHSVVNPGLNQSQQHLQHGQQQGGAQYLPGYLMGDVSIQSGGRSFQTSPMKVMKGSSTSGYLTVSPPSSASNTTPKPSNRMVSKPDKPGGPPVQRLFSAPGLSSAPATPSDFMQVSSTPQVSFSMAPNSEMSANYEDSDPGTWVTVFGFPPTAASYILTQTGMWGHILEHRIPSQGNWMHLKFASRLQARKALARNGRLLTDTLMIGVVPCTDLSIVEDINRKENTFQTQMNQGTPSHINLQRVTSTPQPLKWGDRSQSSFALASNSMTPTAANNTSALDRSSLRPLTQAFKGAQADYEVTQNRGTPQQNTSLVSKAMDFVFGW